MPNLRKKINRMAPMVISAVMLLSVSAAAYGFFDDYWYDEDEYENAEDAFDYEDEETTTPYDPFVTGEEEPSETTADDSETTTTRTTTSRSTTTRTTTTKKTTPPTETTPNTGGTGSQTTPSTGGSGSQTTTPTGETDTSDVPPDETTTGTDSTDDTTTGDVETTTPVVIPPSMSLSFVEKWLEVGEGAQLNAQVLNATQNYTVSFSSSNTNVVRVDASGYIIATGAGSAVVTAYWGDVAGYATIYVTEPPVVPEYIVLNESSFVLKIGETAVIQARVLPEEAAEGYVITFTSNDPSIVSVNENGVLTALKEGETTITVEGAGLYETINVTVSSDIAYDTARLDGYLYAGNGKPISGTHLVIGELSAVTDRDGYFVFDSVEQRSLTIRLADDPEATCGVTVSEDTTVYLLYDQGALTRLASYEELIGRLAISSVVFDEANIVLTAGEVYELSYQYEPADAAVTAINYSSSNSVAAVVGQVDGVITAKSPGETVITISLNNGQAVAECTITVNPRESSEHSVLIMAIEAAVFATVAAVVLLSYRSYKRRALSTLDEEEEEELHDID